MVKCVLLVTAPLISVCESEEKKTTPESWINYTDK